MWPAGDQRNLSSPFSIYPIIAHFTAHLIVQNNPYYCTWHAHQDPTIAHIIFTRIAISFTQVLQCKDRKQECARVDFLIYVQG
jgi:hypothetical protein